MQALPTPPSTATPAAPPMWCPPTGCYGIPGVAITAVQGATQLVASRMLFHPFKVTSPITVNSILLNVSAANATGGATVRIAIYKCDIYGQPAGLVADLGTFAIDGIAVVTKAVSVTLPVGNYLGILHADANCGGAERIISHRGIVPDNNFITSASSGQMNYQYYVSRTYGVFDNPGTAWTSSSTSTGPVIYYFTMAWKPA